MNIVDGKNRPGLGGRPPGCQESGHRLDDAGINRRRLLQGIGVGGLSAIAPSWLHGSGNTADGNDRILVVFEPPCHPCTEAMLCAVATPHPALPGSDIA